MSRKQGSRHTICTQTVSCTTSAKTQPKCLRAQLPSRSDHHKLSRKAHFTMNALCCVGLQTTLLSDPLQTHVASVWLTWSCMNLGTSKAPSLLGSSPLSVMTPSMRAAGVTSKQGFHTCTPAGTSFTSAARPTTTCAQQASALWMGACHPPHEASRSKVYKAINKNQQVVT